MRAILSDGRESDYELEHRVVRDDLLALVRRAGIAEWVIWPSGRHVSHVVESHDLEPALLTIAADPLDAVWERIMDAYVESFEGDPDGLAGVGLRQVWALRRQDPVESRDA